MPDKRNEGKSPTADKEKETEKGKQKIAQEMSAKITSLKKKTECVRKAREQAWETGEDREKDLAKKAKATLYEEMKGVSRIQNRAKRVGLDTERLEQTQVEANEAYLDKGRGKGPQGTGKSRKALKGTTKWEKDPPKTTAERRVMRPGQRSQNRWSGLREWDRRLW